ncbi:glycosyltransferase family 2 protein [Bradyrhizobium manausense]|uniref:glycosyltransferase family 2 protein n=1 Tax=Bradyrhizobium TaxID=374 RepID=UPI001BACFC0C|nr:MULTISPECIES: glycosyltransferase family 2 protein [Bradyrhizobium]MBR0829308.1 glycosyltransferase family 2 protein [Bradyrhizobium manausense]UVO29770.1 glycosyltransferase family 2 protein [Bradyrhizobium arachidis]
MLDVQPPLFSVIIPLEYHRGQWEQSWLGWKSQTVDRSLYEIILVVPPDFSARGELKALAGDGARLEFTESSHDIGLCAFGATKARGQYLFFTESHCWPEPDVIELCIKAIAAHPEWSGFSCKSVPICHNRLSEAEAQMYQADIEFGMKVHPWRKVLDQCFVTRRDVYEECGGLREELGHFAEWVLAAAYHARGHAIGYLEAARFHHYYVGKLGDLKRFTLDFVQGEIRYFSEGRRGPGSELLEIPIEWSCQDNFDSGLARAAFAALLREGFSRRDRQRSGETWPAFRRWVEPALFGDRAARVMAWLVAVHARCVLTAMVRVGSRARISRELKRYIAALIYLQRLDCIHGVRSKDRGALPRLGERVLAQAGFHGLEAWQGRSFRWSEPEAAVRICAQPGRNVVRIECLDVRGPVDRIGVRFHLDGARIADASIMARGGAFEVSLDRPSSATFILAWTCPRFEAVGDERRLGLPVAAIDVTSGAG